MLWRLHRTPDAPPELEEVNEETLHFDAERRRVVLFAGGGVWDGTQPRSKAGCIKYVEQTLASSLNEAAAPVDIFLYTPYLPYDNEQAKANHYNLDRDSLSYYGRQAAQFAVMPLLLKQGETIYDLTPEQLKPRLSKLTLIGHSYGSITIQDVANTLLFELKRAGWDEPTIADTLKELVGISVASIARTDYPAPNITQYFFTSMNDMTAVESIRNAVPNINDFIPLLRNCGYKRVAKVLSENGIDMPQQELLHEVYRQVMESRHPGSVPKAKIEQKPSGWVLRSLLPDHVLHWLESAADGSLIERRLGPEEAALSNTAVVHDYRNYLHGDHMLGELLVNVVNNAVNRSVGIGDGRDLLATTELTRDQNERHYTYDRTLSERGLVSAMTNGERACPPCASRADIRPRPRPEPLGLLNTRNDRPGRDR